MKKKISAEERSQTAGWSAARGRDLSWARHSLWAGHSASRHLRVLDRGERRAAIGDDAEAQRLYIAPANEDLAHPCKAAKHAESRHVHGGHVHFDVGCEQVEHGCKSRGLLG